MSDLSQSGITLQVEVLSILIITAVLLLFMVIINHAIKNADPLAKPKGLVLIAMIYYQMMHGLTKDNMGAKAAQKFAPYIASLALYMAVSNLLGLLGFNQPTGNYSVTLALALITFVMVQSTKIKTNGVGGYAKGFFEPVAPFVIMNVFGTFAPLISMSLRLFGNITSGGTIMMLVYTFTNYVSQFVPLIGRINFLGVIVAPALHAYFDVFSGLIQTYIFIMLTTIFIGNELPQE